MITCSLAIALLLFLIAATDELLKEVMFHFTIAAIFAVTVAFFITLFVYLLTPVLTRGA